MGPSCRPVCPRPNPVFAPLGTGGFFPRSPALFPLDLTFARSFWLKLPLLSSSPVPEDVPSPLPRPSPVVGTNLHPGVHEAYLRNVFAAQENGRCEGRRALGRAWRWVCSRQVCRPAHTFRRSPIAPHPSEAPTHPQTFSPGSQGKGESTECETQLGPWSLMALTF